MPVLRNRAYIAILLYCCIAKWLNCYADLDTLLQPTPTHSHLTM